MRVGKKEFFYAFLMGMAVGIGFIKTIVFGACLSPQFMGYYSIAITISGYGTFLQLGLMSGLNRELPVCLGRGRKKYSSSLVGETTIAVILLQLVGLVIYYAVVVNITFEDFSVRNAFLLAGLLVVAATFGQMVILRLRAEQRILSFSSVQLINALGVLILGFLAIQSMSYVGAILATALVNIVSFMIVSKTVLNPVNYSHFKLKEIIYLIRIGFPMMTVGVLVNLQLSMDRLFLIKNVSSSEIGIYQIGILPLTVGIVISSIISQYVGPKLLFRYGQGESLKYVFNRSIIISLVTVSFLFILWPFVIYLARHVIDLWLPEYRSSLPLISIFYLGTIFTSANISNVVILAANRQVLSLYLSIFTTIICFIGYLMIGYYDMPIKWYASMNVASQILGFFLIIALAYYVVQENTKIKSR